MHACMHQTPWAAVDLRLAFKHAQTSMSFYYMHTRTDTPSLPTNVSHYRHSHLASIILFYDAIYCAFLKDS